MVCSLQAKELIDTINLVAGDRVDGVALMLPRIIDADKIPLLLNVLSDHELDTLSGRVGTDFFHFNPKNPTGRYKLDLKDEFDWLVAQSLIDFTNDEILFCTRNGMPDVSQHGSYTGAWRNCTLDRGMGDGPQPFVYSTDWKCPSVEKGGIMRFDFVSTNRPSKRAAPIPAHIMHNLRVDMAEAYNVVAPPPKQKLRCAQSSLAAPHLINCTNRCFASLSVRERHKLRNGKPKRSVSQPSQPSTKSGSDEKMLSPVSIALLLLARL